MTSPSDEARAIAVPLLERMRSVDIKLCASVPFQWAEDGTETGHSHIPYGALLHEAATRLAELAAEVARLKDREAVLLVQNHPEGDTQTKLYGNAAVQYGLNRAEQAERERDSYKTARDAYLFVRERYLLEEKDGVAPFIERLKTELTQARAAREGMVCVPREPTEAMLAAAMQHEDDEPMSDWGKIVPASHADIYKAMLSAAEKQS